MIPKDVQGPQFECDHDCSEGHNDLFAVSWYRHVLPQLRDKTWYGQNVIEAIQKPGETIYIPHGQAHAVLNLDENLSVTENFLSLGAMDELAKFHAFDWNLFQFDSEGASERVWRNLMNRDLMKDRDARKYGQEMLRQCMTMKPKNGRAVREQM